MSPRAAWRLEALGFAEVYDYVLGKADWLAAGLPTEGSGTDEPRAIDVVEKALTCTVETPVSHIPDGDPVVVVTDGDIVQGTVGPGIRRAGAATAESVMDPGPVTVRADESLEPLVRRMREKHVSHILVTTAGGRLLGVVRSVTHSSPDA